MICWQLKPAQMKKYSVKQELKVAKGRVFSNDEDAKRISQRIKIPDNYQNPILALVQAIPIKFNQMQNYHNSFQQEKSTR